MVENDLSLFVVLPDKFRKFEQGARHAAFYGQERRGGEGFIGVSQARGKRLQEVLPDFGMILCEFIKSFPADELKGRTR